MDGAVTPRLWRRVGWGGGQVQLCTVHRSQRQKEEKGGRGARSPGEGFCMASGLDQAGPDQAGHAGAGKQQARRWPGSN